MEWESDPPLGLFLETHSWDTLILKLTLTLILTLIFKLLGVMSYPWGSVGVKSIIKKFFFLKGGIANHCAFTIRAVSPSLSPKSENTRFRFAPVPSPRLFCVSSSIKAARNSTQPKFLPRHAPVTRPYIVISSIAFNMSSAPAKVMCCISYIQLYISFKSALN